MIVGGGSTAGSVRFAGSAATVPEDAGQVTLAAQRTGGDDGAISVQVTTAEGTAGAGSDFTEILATLSWRTTTTTPRRSACRSSKTPPTRATRASP